MNETYQLHLKEHFYDKPLYPKSYNYFSNNKFGFTLGANCNEFTTVSLLTTCLFLEVAKLVP
jgi:hypothetical protein